MKFNQPLCDLVLNKKGAIEHTEKFSDLEKLNRLLKHIFPTDICVPTGSKYYYSGNSSTWVGVDVKPNLEIIPLERFFEVEEKPDLLQRIEAIEKQNYIVDQFLRVAHPVKYQKIKDIVDDYYDKSTKLINEMINSEGGLDLPKMERQLDEALEKETPETLKEFLDKKPITAVPEYVRCVDNSTFEDKLTNGKIYEVLEAEEDDYYLVVDNTGISGDFYRTRFEPATLSDFEQQSVVEGKTEWKPNVGEWAYSITFDTCGLVSELLPDGKGIKVHKQDNTQYCYWTIVQCRKPTQDEIEKHLTAIAEKKYPVGTKVRHTGESAYFVSGEFKYTNGILVDALIGNNGFILWSKELGWAEVLEDKGERWKPKYDERYWFVTFSGNIKTSSYVCKGAPLDENYYKSGNCFPSEEAAQELAEKIKSLLNK